METACNPIVGLASGKNKTSNIESNEAISVHLDWQHAERAAWVEKYGVQFPNFARAIAQAVTERRIGIRFPDGRIRVTPSQLATDYGCPLDGLQNALRHLAANPLLADEPIWGGCLVKTRSAKPGPKGIEQEWQFPCQVRPPEVVLSWMAKTATGASRINRPGRSNTAQAAIDRLRRPNKSELTAPGGHHYHGSSKKNSSSSQTTPTTAPGEVGGVGLGNISSQEIQPLMTEAMQQKGPATVDGLQGDQERLMAALQAPEGPGLNPGGAKAAAAATTPQEAKALADAGRGFLRELLEGLRPEAQKSPEALLVSRLRTPGSRREILARAASYISRREAAISAGDVGELPPGALDRQTVLGAWRAAVRLMPPSASAGYLEAHDRERAAWSACLTLARLEDPARAGHMDAAIQARLQAENFKPGSLTWRRAFAHRAAQALAEVTPWLREAMVGVRRSNSHN